MPTQQIHLTDEELNEQLYNILMYSIEPDLTTDMLPLLDEIYLDESPEEHVLRMKRYADALQTFKDRSAKFTHDCKLAMSNMKDEAIAQIKEEHAVQNKSDIKNIEDSLENS